MADDPLGTIDAEIARLTGVIEGLKVARGLFGRDAPPEPRPAQLRLPAPKPRKKAKAKPARKAAVPTKKTGADAELSHAWSVNGKSIACSEQQAALMEMLEVLEAGVCLPSADLIGIFDNDKTRLLAAIRDMNVRMRDAGAQIAGVKGAGFRLENIA